jgi:AcrR family transcriptional regulator
MTETDARSGSRMERKKEETRRKIIAAAVSLFNQQGLAETTMEQIAEAADIAKGTLYAYYPVKEAIIVAFMQAALQGQNPRRTQQMRDLPDTAARMRLVFADLMAGVQRQKDVFETYLLYRVRSMISFHVDEGLKSGFYLLGEEIIRLGQQSGEIRTDWPQLLVEDLFEFTFIEVTKQFYLSTTTFQSQTAIDQAVDLFMQAVKPVNH